ncbi:NTP transferase domain-containing protein [Rufibacter sp. LB8]|uniref:nucleotidyltransferase family protein n=1 Tax=Rufibacter sp. LB8 TaxID=2777781 RepID=UPI00178C4A36|nr:nucleotidyltransferase family protein [Rufibacter sp. LB8]
MPKNLHFPNMTETGILILAAGASFRLGQPKQNLVYQGQTLLERTIETATQATLGPIVVVLGANSQQIQSDLTLAGVTVTHNPHWEMGMASSLKVGLSLLLEQHLTVSQVLILLCDQPLITPQLLREMVQNAAATPKPIIACAYRDTVGVPVLFKQSFFIHLKTLTGQEGAKKLLKQFPDQVLALPFEPAAVDIDTLADYQALQNN